MTGINERGRNSNRSSSIARRTADTGLPKVAAIPAAAPADRRIFRSSAGPEGELLFAEHGRAPDQAVMRWQDWLTPLWKRIGGGCHLNRKMDALIESAGFRIYGLRAKYQNLGPRPFAFVYEGTARPI